MSAENTSAQPSQSGLRVALRLPRPLTNPPFSAARHTCQYRELADGQRASMGSGGAGSEQHGE